MNDFSFLFFISPGDRYSRIVFTSAEGETLWNLAAIKSMCNVDNSRVCKIKLEICCTQIRVVSEIPAASGI